MILSWSVLAFHYSLWGKVIFGLRDSHITMTSGQWKAFDGCKHMELSSVLCATLEGWDGGRYGGEGWRVGGKTHQDCSGRVRIWL